MQLLRMKIESKKEKERRERTRGLHASERAFVDKLVSRGKQASILRSGWPDFLITEGKKTYAVEVKVRPDVVSVKQAQMFTALNALGIAVFVWTPNEPNTLIAWRKWPRESGDVLRKKPKRRRGEPYPRKLPKYLEKTLAEEREEDARLGALAT
jgi:hypothetical protein